VWGLLGGGGGGGETVQGRKAEAEGIQSRAGPSNFLGEMLSKEGLCKGSEDGPS